MTTPNRRCREARKRVQTHAARRALKIVRDLALRRATVRMREARIADKKSSSVPGITQPVQKFHILARIHDFVR